MEKNVVAFFKFFFMKTILFILLFLKVVFGYGQQSVFVAVDGSPGGDGTITSPYDIITAFKSQNDGGVVILVILFF